MVSKTQNIPDGWEVKKIKDCFDFLRTSNYSRAETSKSGYAHYIHYGDIHCKYNRYASPDCIDIFVSKEQASRAERLRNGDLILLDASEDYDGATKCVELRNIQNDYVVSGLHTIALRDKGENFAPLFSGYLTSIPFVKKEFIRQISGIKVYGISKTNLSKINLIVPPLPEQKRIAEVLGCWDEGIERLEKIISLKNQQKKGLMQRLLTGKTRLPSFTQPWKEVKLGEVSDLYQPQTISQEDLKNSGYPVYGANGFIGYYNKHNHDTWQIMITCRGSTCGTVNRTEGKAWITGNAMVVNADKHDNDKLFLYYYLLNTNFSSVISGSGQPQIVRSPLSNWKINIPIDHKEQSAIASVLSEADNEITKLKQKLELFKQQKKWLMQQLLTGKKRLAC